MMQEALSIRAQNVWKLKDVGRVLRRGRARLLGAGGEDVSLPEPLWTLLKDAVRNLEKGRSLVLVPEEKQLTTQEAADLLRVSRPYLIRLLDAGEMPYRLVGKHRRIALGDVVEYAKQSAARRATLDKMARDAHKAGLYAKARMPKGGRDE